MLFGKCNSVAGMGPLLDALGFRALVLLDDGQSATLGVVGDCRSPMIARGEGSLRAFAFEVTSDGDFRSELRRVALRLASRAPRLLWLVAAVRQDVVALAVVDVSRAHPRVTSLVAGREAVVDSDSETLCALASARGPSDFLTYSRWIDILGRDSLSRKFFRALASLVAGMAATLEHQTGTAAARDLALLHVSRMLFLSFLETKGWLDRDHGFLANRYADCMVSGGGYHRRVLAPLFFGTLNTSVRNRASRARSFGRIPFLNGGLFARSSLERMWRGAFFDDEVLGDLFGDLLARYRFTAREDSTSWSEAAIDPEMLGKAFESLMSAQDRKRSGAFYTPQPLVAQLTHSVLSLALASPAVEDDVVSRALTGELPPARDSAAIVRAIDEVSILDPACGSGAFLVHAMEELSQLRHRLDDGLPLHALRRSLLTRSIFGVDVNPMAVWLCELRLWLSMAIDDPETDPLRVAPLPNLDRNIRAGNSLSGDDFSTAQQAPSVKGIVAMRSRYARSTGRKKIFLARALDRLERAAAIDAAERRMRQASRERADLLTIARSRDLFGDRRHPAAETANRLRELRSRARSASAERRRLRAGAALAFSFPSGFADIAARGGFDAVIGNPPWVRTGNIEKESRESLRESFEVFRNAAWKRGSTAAAAGRGFGSQVDAAALFVERSVRLLRPGGTTGLVVPAKLWRSLAGGGVRDFLRMHSNVREINDLGSSSRAFEAAAYPSTIVASRGGDNLSAQVTLSIVSRDAAPGTWRSSPAALGFDATPGSPWILLPPRTRQAFDALTSAGIPMAESVFGRPLLGVKTGCNDAFLVREIETDGAFSRVSASGRDAVIESCMLRPAIRGDAVAPWRVAPDCARIIWTHGEGSRPLEQIPPRTLSLLRASRRALERRTDARNGSRWWSLFRTEAADCSLPRVVWPDIGRSPAAAVLAGGDEAVPINTCYAVRAPSLADALALAAVINCDLMAAWLRVIAEPARGGYSRYLGWTMAMLPVPKRWESARALLAPLAERAIAGVPPDPPELTTAVLQALGIDECAVASLLEWNR